MKRMVPIAAVLACLTGPAVAIDMPVATIAGPWVGEGFVQKDEASNPVKVRCQVDGTEVGEEIGFAGECRAFLVVKRAIGAWLTRSGEKYAGTYEGSNVGIAALAGTQTDPETVTLTMTFPREVNGDRTARMVITRPDSETFTITTEDEMTSGATVTTSQITFARK